MHALFVVFVNIGVGVKGVLTNIQGVRFFGKLEQFVEIWKIFNAGKELRVIVLFHLLFQAKQK